MIQAIKLLNKHVLLKLVTNMAGNHDERAFVVFSVLLDIHYALFIAIRMNGAEMEKVSCVLDSAAHSENREAALNGPRERRGLFLS